MLKSVSIAPMLSVRHGVRALEFYKCAFGAREVFKIEDSDGAVVAQLAIQDAKFWIADESPEYQNFSPETLGGTSTRLVLVLDDPSSVHAQALAHGAKQVSPVQEENGWLIGRVVDPFGHHWEIGKPISQNVGE